MMDFDITCLGIRVLISTLNKNITVYSNGDFLTNAAYKAVRESLNIDLNGYTIIFKKVSDL